MTIRQKFARSLRKWADLIDPRVSPTGDAVTIRIDVDSTQAEQQIARLQKAFQKARSSADSLKS